MKSVGCQTENETSAGCGIWPRTGWGSDLELGSVWTRGYPHGHSVIDSRILTVAGKVPWLFTQRGTERSLKAWKLIKELIIEWLNSMNTLFSFLLTAALTGFFFQCAALHMLLGALMRDLCVVWGSMHGLNGRSLYGHLQVCFKGVYPINPIPRHPK